MKKLYSLLVSLLIALSLVLSNGLFVKAKAVTVDEYYSSASTSSGEALARTLHSIISSGTKDVGYDGLYDAYKTTDCKPGTNIVWDMYSNYEYNVTKDMVSNYKKEGDGFNREHSVPQSWFDKKSPMRSDLFHVYPTDAKVNGIRSNYIFGEVSNPTTITGNGSKLGPSALSSHNGTVFEPIDEYKGDFARTYFYMAIRYSDKVGSWIKGADVAFKGSYPYLTNYCIELFTKWHNEDPVSDKERARNEAVYNIQKNRNPFIDHPDWSTIIWGGTYGGGGATSTYSVNYVVPEGVTFNYRDTQRYEANSTITMPNVTPIKEGYTFDAWYSDQTYTTKWNFASNTINKNLTLYARMNIDETQLPSIFTRDTKMEVALGINYSMISSGSTTTTPSVSRTAQLGFDGSFGSNNIEKNTSADINKNVIAKDDTNISELFDFSYEDTGKGNIYISGGKIRLYYLPSGKGSKLVVRAKDGVKISDIAATSTASGCLCKVSSDGKEAYIQASTAKEGGNFEFTGFTVKYETNSASYSYQVNKVDLKARYLIPEEIYNLINKNQSDVKYFMSFNDTKTQCQVVKEGHYYVVMAQINTDSLDTKYNIVGTVTVGNTTYTTKQITYSASDIAKKLVLEYGEDILDIENLSQVLNEIIPNE